MHDFDNLYCTSAVTTAGGGRGMSLIKRWIWGSSLSYTSLYIIYYNIIIFLSELPRAWEGIIQNLFSPKNIYIICKTKKYCKKYQRIENPPNFQGQALLMKSVKLGRF